MTPLPGGDDELAELWAVALSILGAAIVVVAVGFLVARAGRAPFPGSVITSLTTLAALSLVGYAIGGDDRPELAAIAGTAVGALAGATTSVLARIETTSGDGERDGDDLP